MMSWPDGSPAAAARRAAALIAVLRPADPAAEPSAAAVARVLREHGEPEPVTLTSTDVAQLRTVAAGLLAVFAAPDVGSAARLINQMLSQTGPPRLADHGGAGWHLHVDAGEDASWASWLASSSALALATLLASRQARPGGVCAARACHQPFADSGQGGPRRYCSARCATRARVAAHRRSRRAAAG